MFLDDVDYLEEIITYVIYAPCHDHLVPTCISIAPRASRTPLMSMHAPYSSQENEVGPEEQETQEQELPGGPKAEGELQECPDHKPSTFEKGKPQSILSLPILANLIDIV